MFSLHITHHFSLAPAGRQVYSIAESPPSFSSFESQFYPPGRITYTLRISRFMHHALCLLIL